ncbi:hypothetical protein [Micromonospora sp. DT227]|uniref:hypothetical protein n=1 Tax=Micromonospora sp. DT227 TaxID=3393433 RepID=UPI003CF67805
MHDTDPIVTYNPDAARRWLTEAVTVGGATITRARHLGIRKKYKSNRDEIEMWAFKLVEALENAPRPDVWNLHAAASIEVYPTPDLYEGGGLVVVQMDGRRFASAWEMFSTFAAGEEQPGLDAAVDALGAVAELANNATSAWRAPRVTFDEDALREWLTHPEHYFMGSDWTPDPDTVGDLLEDLHESGSAVAGRALQLHGLTGVFAIRVSGGKRVFGADVAGRGRICTTPMSRVDLATGGFGPDAAITAMLRVAREINAAFPRH